MTPTDFNPLVMALVAFYWVLTMALCLVMVMMFLHWRDARHEYKGGVRLNPKVK